MSVLMRKQQLNLALRYSISRWYRTGETSSRITHIFTTFTLSMGIALVDGTRTGETSSRITHNFTTFTVKHAMGTT